MEINQNKLSTRLLSLDVFRGITIAVMIIVNCPGLSTAYSFLEHSDWNGCTLADLVFPCFIMILGVSSAIALSNSKKRGRSNKQLLKDIIKRSLYLFFIGILLNIFLKNFDLTHIRILGVLQRLALCYFFTAIVFLFISARSQVIFIALSLIGYYLLVTYFSGDEPLSITNNVVSKLDHLIFYPQNLYRPLFDPEGFLSTFSAILSALMGNLVGFCLLSSRTQIDKFQKMLITGFLLSLLGWIWSFYCPFNKFIWSSSYVLWTGGISIFVFSVIFALIEIKKITFWSNPFTLLGKNALLIYILHIVFLKIQMIIQFHKPNGELTNLKHFLTDSMFGYLTPNNASLAYAITYTILWIIFFSYLTRYIEKQ